MQHPGDQTCTDASNDPPTKHPRGPPAATHKHGQRMPNARANLDKNGQKNVAVVLLRARFNPVPEGVTMRTMLGFAGALALVAACGGRASLSSDDPQAGSAGAATATGGGGLASDGAAGTAPGSPDAAGIPPMDGSMGGGPSVRKRLIFFYTPHGTVLDAWRPAADADHRLTNMGTILQS